jgi:glycosyltransferase involved in cell wall biosynthesis
MKISYYTEKGNLDKSVGYGNAGFQIVRSLQELGHEVPFDDPTAPVQISFCNPARAKLNPGQYQIVYTPWESTSLPDKWLEAFNAGDEVWATSQWVADVYKAAGVTKPIFVYEHGVNEIWKNPVKRERQEQLRFLHIGEPAPRKGGQMAFDAFRAAFGDREDVHLTIKAHHQNYIYSWKDGDIAKLDEFSNVSMTDKHFFEHELLDLYYDHDALIYPSYGEGFGLIPLQALATGMPVVSTYEWAPYRQYLITLEAQKFQSPWFFHPGKMYTPDYDHLVEIYKYLDKEFEVEADFSFKSAPYVIADYNWRDKTEQAFAHIVERFTGN